MRALWGLVLAALPAYPLACTSAASGDWSAAATWANCGGGVPVSGDTVTLVAPHVVTVSDARTVGVGTGTAIERQGSGSSFGRLVIAGGAVLTLRGNFIDSWTNATVIPNARTVRIEEGGVLEFSATEGVSYSMGPHSTQARGNCGIEFAGSPGNFAEVRSTVGANPATVSQSGGAANLFVSGSHFRFRRMGSATVAGLRVTLNTSPAVTLSVSNFEFDQTGGLVVLSTISATTFALRDGVFQRSVGTNSLCHSQTGVVGAGTRLIERVYFDRPWGNIQGSTHNHNGVTMTDIVHIGRPTPNGGGGAAGPITDFLDIRLVDDWNHVAMGPSYTRFLMVKTAVVANSHKFAMDQRYGTTMTGGIFDEFTRSSQGSGEGDVTLTPTANPATPLEYIFDDVIVLPNPDGSSPGTGATLYGPSGSFVLNVTGATNTSPITVTTSAAHGLANGDRVWITNVGGNTAANGSWPVTVTGTTTFTLDGSAGSAAYTSGGSVFPPKYNVRLRYRNWTYATGDPLGSGRALLTVGENFVWHPLYINEFRNNLVWSEWPAVTTSSQKLFAFHHSTSRFVPDVLNPATTSHNALWNGSLSTPENTQAVNQGDGFALRFSSPAMRPTVGSLVSVNPGFVDRTRNFAAAANYMAARLGIPAPAAWANATAYAVGDYVTHATPGIWYGQRIRYRCVAAHTSGAASEPGTGASWQASWEPATRQYLLDQYLDLANGTGGRINGRTWNREIYHWIAAGFIRRNLAYRAGSGQPIGASGLQVVFIP